jgi:hypothetical protein
MLPVLGLSVALSERFLLCSASILIRLNLSVCCCWLRSAEHFWHISLQLKLAS